MGGVQTEAGDDVRLPEIELFSFLKGVFGLFAACTALFLLMFNSPISATLIYFGSVSIPATIIMCACATVLMFVMRLLSEKVATKTGAEIVSVLALACSVLASLGLLSDITLIPAVILLSVGTVAFGYGWLLYLCNFTHKILVVFLSMILSLSVIISALIMLLNVSRPVLSCIICVLVIISWVLLRMCDSEQGEALSHVSKKDSAERAITVSNDRWTFSIIGIDFGFAIGLTIFSQTFGLNPDSAPIPSTTMIIIVAGSFAVASILLLFARPRLKYAVEKYSKDFLTFTIAFSVLPMWFLQPEGRLVCLFILLFVSFVQMVIATNASVEFIRFEELSIAWYLGEDGFICGGMCVGLILGYFGVFPMSSIPNLAISCAAIVAINAFAQPFFNNGTYPILDKYELEQPASKDVARDVEIRTMRTAALKIPIESHIDMAPEREGTGAYISEGQDQNKRVGIWKRKVAVVADQYDLSPRQAEILEFLSHGRDARFLEEHFCISHSTAKSHIYNIYLKLDIHSRQELIDIIERVSTGIGER